MPNEPAEKNEDLVIPEELPLLQIRDVVVYPYMILPLFVGREPSIRAVNEALAKDRLIFLAAQKEITDVVFVDLPAAGKEVKAGEAIAVVESVKAAFDIYAPVSGKISKINEAVSKDPALVNQSPYESGWLFSIDKSSPADNTNLMDHSKYQEFVKTNGH